jgi:hypothetical protein
MRKANLGYSFSLAKAMCRTAVRDRPILSVSSAKRKLSRNGLMASY